MIRSFFDTFFSYFRRNRLEQEMDEELRFHIDMETEKLVERGMSPEAARREALRTFGGVVQTKENLRDVHYLIWLESLTQDLRYAMRSLSKNPGYMVMVVIILALGIGANTALFSMINTTLLRSLPVKNPEDIVQIFTNRTYYEGRMPYHDTDGLDERFGSTSYHDFNTFREQGDLFSGVIAFRDRPASYIGRAGYGIEGVRRGVTGNFFSFLGVRPILGREFTAEEAEGPGNAVVMLGYGAWQRLFGGDRNVIGETVKLDGNIVTVIGVVPQAFKIGPSVDVWVPHGGMTDRYEHGVLSLFARLQPGVTIEQTSQRLNLIVSQQDHTFSPERQVETVSGAVVALLPEEQVRVPIHMRESVLSSISLLGIIVILTLVLACANAANLLVARTIVRRYEIAVRLSLGAGRRRLIQYFLIESLLLAMLASGLGLLLAYAGVNALAASPIASMIPVKDGFDLDGATLAFTTTLAILTTLLFGLLPALQATRKDPMTALKSTSTILGLDARMSRLRNGLVIVQVSVSLLLLTGAGLFLRSLQETYAVDVGFKPENILSFSVNLSHENYSLPASIAFCTDIIARMEALPGVASATIAGGFPFESAGKGGGDFMIGDTPRLIRNDNIVDEMVGPGYFTTMKIPLLRGRDFGTQDGWEFTGDMGKDIPQPGVVIVNEAFADRFWRGQDPIGKEIYLTGDNPDPRNRQTVVGVVKNVTFMALDERPQPILYYPITQMGWMLHLMRMFRPRIIVYTEDTPSGLASLIRQEMQALNPDLPLYDITTFEDYLAQTDIYLPARTGSLISGLFGIAGLLIAMLGLYSVMTYLVSQRAHEISIRMAVGARPGNIMSLIITKGLTLTLAGVGLGLLAALWLTRFLENYLYKVSPTDPFTIAGIVCLMIVTALLSSYMPAHRAMHIDPMISLRHE